MILTKKSYAMLLAGLMMSSASTLSAKEMQVVDTITKSLPNSVLSMGNRLELSEFLAKNIDKLSPSELAQIEHLLNVRMGEQKENFVADANPIIINGLHDAGSSSRDRDKDTAGH